MITENELQISNKSYINKDFGAVYQEILELAKKISYKYDPETSNESDPFIVVLKLLAFVTDKLDYNIDKNVLERFMPSATQETSMRELCAMQGYDMHYYVAPTTKVTFKYIGDEADEIFELGKTIKLPGLDTVISTEDGSVQYVTTTDVVLTGKNQTSFPPVEVIQGQKKRLIILNSEKVLLENIDDNNRVYFPEQMVAENGVFIDGGNITIGNEWTRVTNLNTQEIGSFVYKFGFDSNKRLPYIEFPSDIANLIGSGLTIDYIVTDGARGNVKSKALTKLNFPTQVDMDGTTIRLVVDTEDQQPIVITNTNASINGKDPETINEAYNSFKKTIGTFDTLVTCRDYMNFIYNLLDDDNIFPLVSNVQVSDRRTDINATNKILTYNQFGKYIVNTSTAGATMTPYDLCLYPLRPMYDYTLQNFKESFMQLVDTLRVESKTTDAKCISHTYIHPEDFFSAETKKIFALKNYYNLTARIATTYKVNASEQIDILSNINTALIKKFNARNVDFGYELPYDTILETIENADTRIKTVVLSEPELTTSVMTTYKDTDNKVVNEEIPLNSAEGNDYYIPLVAKNVLAGSIELFNYNNTFSYDFGQTQSQVKSDVLYCSTDANITIPTTNDGYTLLTNEVIQLVSPSLVTDKTYPYGIGYNLKLSSGRTEIQPNVEYQLQSGEYCIFTYTNMDEVQVVDIYREGEILKTKIVLKTTESHGGTPSSKSIEDVAKYEELSSLGALVNGKLPVYFLATNDEVYHRVINEVNYSANNTRTPLYCYWIVNDEDNKIVFSGDATDGYTYMLNDGEYFFQTDPSFTALHTYGSGTVISQKGFPQIWEATKIDLSEIDENGILGNKEKFTERDVTILGNTLSFLEQTIITLAEGDAIKLNDASSSYNVGIEFEELTESISYKFKDETAFKSLTENSYDGGYWKIRGRLSINAGPEQVQTLVGNQEVQFKVSIDDPSPLVVTSGKSFYLSSMKNIVGSSNFFIGNTNILESVDGTPTVYPIEVYTFALDTSTSAQNRSVDGYETVALESGSSITRTLPVANQTDNRKYSTTVMFYVVGNPTSTSYPRLTTTNCTFTNLKEGTTNQTQVALDGICVCSFYSNNASNVASFTISSVGDYAGNIIIAKPRVINGAIYQSGGELTIDEDTFNPRFKLEDAAQAVALYDKIREFDTDKIFYYNNVIDNSKAIDVEDFRSPYALYDYNNIANKWTISEIDFAASDISIMRGSKQ